VLLAECKWSTRPVDRDVLEGLKAKLAALTPDLERPPARADFALFSRAGFTAALAREAERQGVLLATVEDVLAAEPI
jgi:hypothetical protein